MAVQLNTKGQTYKGISTAFRIVGLIFLLATAVILIRIVYLFFGQLKTAPGYQFIIEASDRMMVFISGFGRVPTPYQGGEFDIGATVLLIALILIEFVINGIARYFNRRAIDNMIVDDKPPTVQVLIAKENEQDDLEIGLQDNNPQEKEPIKTD